MTKDEFTDCVIGSPLSLPVLHAQNSAVEKSRASIRLQQQIQAMKAGQSGSRNGWGKVLGSGGGTVVPVMEYEEGGENYMECNLRIGTSLSESILQPVAHDAGAADGFEAEGQGIRIRKEEILKNLDKMLLLRSQILRQPMFLWRSDELIPEDPYKRHGPSSSPPTLPGPRAAAVAEGRGDDSAIESSHPTGRDLESGTARLGGDAFQDGQTWLQWVVDTVFKVYQAEHRLEPDTARWVVWDRVCACTPMCERVVVQHPVTTTQQCVTLLMCGVEHRSMSMIAHHIPLSHPNQISPHRDRRTTCHVRHEAPQLKNHTITSHHTISGC